MQSRIQVRQIARNPSAESEAPGQAKPKGPGRRGATLQLKEAHDRTHAKCIRVAVENAKRKARTAS